MVRYIEEMMIVLRDMGLLLRCMPLQDAFAWVVEHGHLIMVIISALAP